MTQQQSRADDGRTAHETAQKPAETLALVLDPSHATGREWAANYAEPRDEDEPPVVRVEVADRDRCEEDGSAVDAPTYRLAGGRQSVSVCRECLASYEWVADIQTTRPSE